MTKLTIVSPGFSFSVIVLAVRLYFFIPLTAVYCHQVCKALSWSDHYRSLLYLWLAVAFESG